jgi:DNA-binding transcriptional regulator YdaS (Cro superfamily)
MKDATLEPRPQELWLDVEAGGDAQLLGLMTLKEEVMNQWSSAPRDPDSAQRHSMVVNGLNAQIAQQQKSLGLNPNVGPDYNRSLVDPGS